MDETTKAKEHAAEAERLRLEELKPDVEKIGGVIDQLQAIKIPKMATADGESLAKYTEMVIYIAIDDIQKNIDEANGIEVDRTESE